MAQSQTAVTPPRSRERTKSDKAIITDVCPVADPAGELTFITAEGELITFTDLGMPLGDATAIAGEEALGKIWDRPAEDVAWRDM